RAELLRLRGVIEARTGDLRSAVSVFLEAADATNDESLTLELLTEAAEAAAYAGDFSQATALSLRAATIAPRSETDRFRVAAMSGVAADLAGDHEQAAALLSEAIERAEHLEDPRFLIWAARMANMRGTLGDGLAYATRAVTVARERALLNILPNTLSQQATALTGQGQFQLAYVAAEEGIRLAGDFGHHWGTGWNLANLAMVDALRGEAEKAHAHAAEAMELAAVSGGTTLLVGFAHWSLGLLELTLGRPGEGADILLVVSATDRPESNSLIAQWAMPDLIEAAARSGRLDETGDRLDRYADLVEHSPTPARQSLLARCRALVGDGNTEERFETAISTGSTLSPFEQARTELLYGEWLRRERERIEARRHLRRAADLFHQVGAPPWEERAEAELRATGETARRRDPSTLDELTPQELQIAGLVAGGMTNRQIAAQLYLSPRTIDYHLRKVFTKLGLTSRTELVRMGVPQHQAV
ncbi:MAG: LuxR family transcriptional regulator, partial [Candidatus Rokuibacteriota bacterium]